MSLLSSLTSNLPTGTPSVATPSASLPLDAAVVNATVQKISQKVPVDALAPVLSLLLSLFSMLSETNKVASADSLVKNVVTQINAKQIAPNEIVSNVSEQITNPKALLDALKGAAANGLPIDNSVVSGLLNQSALTSAAKLEVLQGLIPVSKDLDLASLTKQAQALNLGAVTGLLSAVPK